MNDEITITLDVLYIDHLGRYTEEGVNKLLKMANALDAEADEKHRQAFTLREIAETLSKANALFDLSPAGVDLKACEAIEMEG
jgi:hypothetical protein